jgi:hypothetical protein
MDKHPAAAVMSVVSAAFRFPAQIIAAGHVALPPLSAKTWKWRHK